MKRYILSVLILLWSLAAAAVEYPQYKGQTRSAYSAQQASRYESSTNHSASVFSSTTADEWYENNLSYTLATDPYGEPEAGTTPTARRKPGSGTGVIPNATPLGDGLWVLLLLAAFYAVFRRRDPEETRA